MQRLDGPARAQLQRVNQDVNAQVRFMFDSDSSGEEEVWSYPIDDRGECEDSALEKRRRLVAMGWSRAAPTMAIVHHRSRYCSHAVLLAETTAGTLMLDSLSDRLLCWSEAPYNFEARERPDGQWDRFDQRDWVYGPVAWVPPRPSCVSGPP